MSAAGRPPRRRHVCASADGHGGVSAAKDTGPPQGPGDGDRTVRHPSGAHSKRKPRRVPCRPPSSSRRKEWAEVGGRTEGAGAHRSSRRRGRRVGGIVRAGPSSPGRAAAQRFGGGWAHVTRRPLPGGFPPARACQLDALGTRALPEHGMVRLIARLASLNNARQMAAVARGS